MPETLDLTEIREKKRTAPPRKRRRKRRIFPILLGLLLFFAGFLLGKVVASQERALPGYTLDLPKSTASEWNLVLVNRDNPIPDGFTIPKMTELRNGHAIDSRAYPSLQKMMDDARAEGLQPLICSSYRTRDEQENLYLSKVRTYLDEGYSQKEAEELAAFWVARPGTSEHEIGLAVDIVDMNYQHLDEKQESTPVQLWLMENCSKYGFILRYPTDKSDITGVGYEPWHYRYVGAEAAKEITDKGICLEEYLA